MESISIPDEYLCPISQSLMHDPVITMDGYTFDSQSIREWFSKGNNKNPMTNIPLESTRLIPNRILKSMIMNFKEKHKFQLFLDDMKLFHIEIMEWESKFNDAKQFLTDKYISNGFIIHKSDNRASTEFIICKKKQGHRYEGQHKNGNFQGLGMYFYKNGDVYMGQWKKNQREGRGIYKYANGDRFEGEHKKGKRDGVGLMFNRIEQITHKYIYKDGRVIERIPFGK